MAGVYEQMVALHVRAWVEIPTDYGKTSILPVALHVRAWVEIDGHVVGVVVGVVALHVRAWVEIGRP